jgi:hypothetical protein
MQLREAMIQIAEIRQHLARTETFRGCRAWPTGVTGLIALVAAIAQSQVLPNASQRPLVWLSLWLMVAVISGALISSELVLRYRYAATHSLRSTTWLAVQQFVPSVIAGALITVAIARTAASAMWILPGVWSILVAVGLAATGNLLPRAVYLAAIHYLAAGLLCLLWGQGTSALAPWTMAVTFGIGQLVTSLILFVSLERNRVTI